MNSKLTQYYAFLIIKKDGEISYNGNWSEKLSDEILDTEHLEDDRSYYLQVQARRPIMLSRGALLLKMEVLDKYSFTRR